MSKKISSVVFGAALALVLGLTGCVQAPFVFHEGLSAQVPTPGKIEARGGLNAMQVFGPGHGRDVNRHQLQPRGQDRSAFRPVRCRGGAGCAGHGRPVDGFPRGHRSFLARNNAQRFGLSDCQLRRSDWLRCRHGLVAVVADVRESAARLWSGVLGRSGGEQPRHRTDCVRRVLPVRSAPHRASVVYPARALGAK